MVKVRKNLIGEVFGRLTVIGQDDDYVSPKGNKIRRWICRCSCEDHTVKSIIESRLIDGSTVSCGCYGRERSSETHKKYNEYDLTGGYGIGLTSNTNEEFYFDLDRYDDIKNICWYKNTEGYLSGVDTTTGKIVKMHTYLGYPYYDHINRNKLDNRGANLRPCTNQENCRNKSLTKANTSGFIGVGWHKKLNMWRARISVDNKLIHLGVFETIDDAVRARLRAEKEYYGEFAPQQHLYEQYGI